VERRLLANWRAVKERIAAACGRAGRPAEQVELLAVTKKVSPRLAAALVQLGQTSLAENRAQELERKCEALSAQGQHPDWHFIGTLQRNKARRIVQLANTLHSVDSLRLLETVDRLAGELGKRPRLYLQVNVSHESQKHGFEPEELPEAVQAAAAAPHVELLGLMGMAPRLAAADPDGRQRAARASFDELTALGAAQPGALFLHGEPRYSMGMSADLEQAVAAGSHVVRIGTALFEGLEEDTEVSA
jgi:pyridoxal phosphate enzyme (YggS family)